MGFSAVRVAELFLGTPVYYFGYGSNLNVPHMRGRIPHAKLLGPAVFPRHRIVFEGKSSRGGGSASVTSGMSSIPGALYLMTRADLETLDESEGNPYANHRHNDYVYGMDGTRYEAFMYRHNSGTPVNPPNSEYLKLILDGRRMFGFPVEDVLQAAKEAHHGTP